MKIIQFLEEHNIDYAEKGKNISRDNVGINCPFCRMEGNPDPSKHLGIASTGDVYGCWRNSKHSGRKMWRLVAALLHCSYKEAREIAGEVDTHIPHEPNFSKQVQRMLTPDKTNTKTPASESLLEEWDSAYDLMDKRITAGRDYRSYLRNRGFINLRTLSLAFEIRYATSGKWKNRILFPIRYNDSLVAIIGRSIYPNAQYRYIASDEHSGLKDFIYQQDEIAQGGKALFIAEGVLDCIKLSGMLKENMKVTCAFSNNLSRSQTARISLCARRFDKVFIVFDRGAESNALRLERTSLRGVARAITASQFLPDGIDDPADLGILKHTSFIQRVIDKELLQ